jgi:hypothetical protein
MTGHRITLTLRSHDAKFSTVLTKKYGHNSLRMEDGSFVDDSWSAKGRH